MSFTKTFSTHGVFVSCAQQMMLCVEPFWSILLLLSTSRKSPFIVQLVCAAFYRKPMELDNYDGIVYQIRDGIFFTRFSHVEVELQEETKKKLIFVKVQPFSRSVMVSSTTVTLHILCTQTVEG